MDPFLLAGLALVVGALAGVTSGLFGIGGGVLMVPAILYLVPGTGFHEAKAASLLAMAVAAVAGVHRHRGHGNVDAKRGLVLGVAGIAGAALGVLAAERVTGTLLAIGFAAFLAFTGARLRWARPPRPRDLPRPRALAFTGVIGFLAGVIAGLFGVGGGIIMVPALVFTGVGIHLAVGTSLVAVLVNAWTATATNLALGYGSILLAIGVPAAIGGTLGARYGSDLANRLKAERLRHAFGVFLMVIAVGMGVEVAVLNRGVT